jgi:tRNA-uridine 2-sulfurtransferase
MKGKRVVVGLSGGVDSSVAALLLKEQGYEVIGMFMRNWHDESVTISDECPWIDDSNDALLIANQLGIPFQVIDLSAEYKDKIVDYMFSEYQSGRTPNPDVLCNREIKFDVFLKAAMDLGAEYVATGHYCKRIDNDNGSVSLAKGLDKGKDQSYFLCQLSQKQLTKALFPIGELQKSEVREIAAKAGLLTADKKDSQGLCFVGKIKLPEFLQQQLSVKKGPVVEMPADLDIFQKYNSIEPSIENVVELSKSFDYDFKDGKVVAEHQGAHYYTIGQRKGLTIGGRPEPSFVIKTNTVTNTVFSGQRDDHPGLNRWALFIQESDIHYIEPNEKLKLNETRQYDVRIRYRQAVQQGTLIKKEDGIYILFMEKQRGITPGQFAAWYSGERLIGSGVIKH